MVTPTYWRAKTHDEAREAVERSAAESGSGGCERPLCSARVAASTALSPGVSHAASAGRSARRRGTQQPIATAGSPCISMSHRHPRTPPTPSMTDRIMPDEREPTSEPTEGAVPKRATARPAMQSGNQNVMYSSTPGKKPDSARPRQKRSASSEPCPIARPVPAEKRPQRISVVASTGLAPAVVMMWLLGTCISE